MREKLRNELLTMLNSYVTVDQLQEIEVTLEMILTTMRFKSVRQK